MGRIVGSVKIENLADPAKSLRCDALVNTGASYMILPSAWQDHLYGCGGNNTAGAGRSPNALRCLNWRTGEIVWEEPSVGFFSLIIVDGKLLMLINPGALIAAAATPTGYRELGRAQVIDEKCFAAPVFADNHVYVRNTEGDVVCLDMK